SWSALTRTTSAPHADGPTPPRTGISVPRAYSVLLYLSVTVMTLRRRRLDMRALEPMPAWLSIPPVHSRRPVAYAGRLSRPSCRRCMISRLLGGRHGYVYEERLARLAAGDRAVVPRLRPGRRRGGRPGADHDPAYGGPRRGGCGARRPRDGRERPGPAQRRPVGRPGRPLAPASGAVRRRLSGRGGGAVRLPFP